MDKSEYDIKINELKTAHQREINEVKTAHQREIDELKVITEQQGQIIKKQEEQIRRLLRREAYNDGPNAPPSKGTITWQQHKKSVQDKRSPSGRKQGGQPGHKGATSKPKPDRTETATMESCNICDSKDIRETHVETRTITDTPPPPPPPVTVRYDISHYDCNTCGAKDISSNPDIPKNGSFGKNIARTVVTNFLFRMPNRKNAEYLATLGISMASGTICHTPHDMWRPGSPGTGNNDIDCKCKNTAH